MSDDAPERQIWLVRHGETEWAKSGRHTGRSDIPLTDVGRDQARALGEPLAGRRFALVLTSPRSRAAETAHLAGFPEAIVEPNLREWDYGEFEGRT
ncbi:MAG TPA: histidine phosphatase family protein, partial [Methylomirabilota bacterium]|nr:histidine phosphatase family protein [Methylomirabilota bacterium]